MEGLSPSGPHPPRTFGPITQRGRSTRVEVMVTNEPYLKMCRRLGFTEGAPDERARVELRWYPPHLSPNPKNKPA